MNAIIAGIIGLIAGAIGSLIAPWIHWGIEKKRKKHERRAALIERWREILSNQAFQRGHMLNDPAYGPLRSELTERARKDIERKASHHIVVMDSPVGNIDRNILLDEVARIEKKWDLV